jgi:hypothetical protein
MNENKRESKLFLHHNGTISPLLKIKLKLIKTAKTLHTLKIISGKLKTLFHLFQLPLFTKSNTKLKLIQDVL